jgi:hypothetical protein
VTTLAERPGSSLRILGRYLGGALCALLFFLLGCLFVNRTGVEEDEAMFAAPLFRDWVFFSIPIPHGRIPVMHMSYVGALKTWLYVPIAAVWAPGAAMLRVPAVLIGALTILLFWNLLDASHGRRAAWTGCLLLSTDTIFLLTTTFDWGPVAIQHLLLTSALLLAFQWSQTGRDSWLAAAAFCCGLAFWDKAVFVWMFSGLMAGSLVFLPFIRSRFTWRRAALVVVALSAGAAPLIVYNVASSPKFSTIRSNSKFTAHRFQDRFSRLRSAWKGAGLFGYMVYETTDRPNSPQGAVERASFRLHDASGNHRTNHFELALGASLLLLPALWRTPARDTMLFALVASGVGWTEMVMLDGGSSVHHIVLLWPLPQLFVAVGLAEASCRFRFGNLALAAVVLFLALTNLFVTNQYLLQFIRNGSAGSWTDAIYPLAAALRQARPSQVILVDWGTQDPLSFLNRNEPPARTISDPFMPSDESGPQKQADLELLSDDKVIWVEHTPGNETSAGVNDRLLSVARDAGLEPAMLGAYGDRNGRPIFQTFRFHARR